MDQPEGTSSERVSVVLATYNGAEFLPAQLASLAAQARLPDELVIVDDASADATPDILRAFAAEAPFPVELLLREEHLGTWLTFEEGLRAATGDIIMICDQDDVWREHKVAVLCERLAEHPDALMAFSDARLISSDGELIGHSRWRVAGFSHKELDGTRHDPFAQLFTRQAVSGCTLALRAEVLAAVLPFPAEIHPGLPVMMYDRWISLVAAAAGEVVPVPEKLVDYRIHAGQQIGIPALAIRRIAPQLALRGAQFLHGRTEVEQRMGYHVAHLEEIEKRLVVAHMATPASDARLAAGRRHMRFREGLAAHRRERLGAVLAELRRVDGYRRFSLGAASALADVAR
ncbi:MAG: glycosyltransferase [Acidimicrobiales bacterium]